MCGFTVVITRGILFDYTSSILAHDGSHTHEEMETVNVLRCQHCKQSVVVVEERTTDSPDGRYGPVRYVGMHWWPSPQLGLADDIPRDIALCFKEAANAYSANCWRASAVMARRTVEALTADKGATKKSLAERLTEMRDSNTITTDLHGWATQVRLIGNAGAHFDPLEDVEAEDSMELLLFTRKIPEYVYEMPAQLARLRASRSS